MHFQKGGSPAEKVNAFFQKVVHFLKKVVHFFPHGGLAGKKRPKVHIYANGGASKYMSTNQHATMSEVQVVQHIFQFKNTDK